MANRKGLKENFKQRNKKVVRVRRISQPVVLR